MAAYTRGCVCAQVISRPIGYTLALNYTCPVTESLVQSVFIVLGMTRVFTFPVFFVIGSHTVMSAECV